VGPASPLLLVEQSDTEVETDADSESLIFCQSSSSVSSGSIPLLSFSLLSAAESWLGSGESILASLVRTVRRCCVLSG